jgi:hypothetical protein
MPDIERAQDAALQTSSQGSVNIPIRRGLMFRPRSSDDAATVEHLIHDFLGKAFASTDARFIHCRSSTYFSSKSTKFTIQCTPRGGGPRKPPRCSFYAYKIARFAVPKLCQATRCGLPNKYVFFWRCRVLRNRPASPADGFTVTFYVSVVKPLHIASPK